MAKETLSKVVRVRLTESEDETLKSVSAEMGISVSELLRRGARSVGGFGPTFDGQTRDEIMNIAEQLRAIETNLNQITRVVNRGQVPADETFGKIMGEFLFALNQARNGYLSLCAREQARVLGVAEDAGHGA